MKVTNPAKINKKVVAKGASMCFDGDHTIYATKGNGVPEFWAYDMTSESAGPQKHSYQYPKDSRAVHQSSGLTARYIC